ncbi:hypothetical protein K458DRAFT_331662 [Lentithecium fluviatile CBS 122367]|uniref:Uncharacterized protein n=1 Tax=Lentithecium fluviatile CBS 122367 TaxID=1168545 RepID=A0A6G1JEH3_9PLEO|nr:hypothetical protein K458DRAFT_331662 [Lentithecium fluviatile CBS 122367]
MRLPTLLAFTGLVALASATPIVPAAPRALPQPVPRKPLKARQNDTAPACAKVSQAIYSPPTRPSQIPAALAWDCINSVPFNASSAKRLVEDLPAWLNWQSTLDVLKNPPAEYAEKVQPGIDIIGGLEQIGRDIDAGRFTSEYGFGWVLYTLFLAAHDGHLQYVPDSVGAIFNWGRPVPLVSVSEDGAQLPAVFVYSDVLGMQYKNISYTPSPVIEIDGEEVTEFLESYSQYGGSQDRDALYNNMFYELAQVSLGAGGAGVGMFAGGGRGRFAYPGDTTTLKFANGSEYTMQNYARLIAPHFRGISTGEDLAKTFFNYNTASVDSQSTPVSSAENEAPLAPAAPGYPVPVVPGPSNLINGFYVNAASYEDVAVLQVPSFIGSTGSGVLFQKTTQDFLAKAAADGKTKLIIDLQANGGGIIMQGIDMFKQLFPDQDPWGANRFRYTEAADLMGQSLSEFASQAPRGVNNLTYKTFQGSWFDYHMDMTVDAKPFESWQQKVGPVEVNGDKYTTLSRWNLSDVLISFVSGGVNVTGYGPLANVTGPPRFKPENIVLLTDGYCASTCTIFSELMTQQAGVKTIAMGGRANKEPIQALGGVKGVNNFAYAYIQQTARAAIRFAPSGQEAKYNVSALRQYDSSLVLGRAATNPSLNSRDGLRRNDASGVALQFIYEEADCRLYYTPEMTVDATAIWKAAADAQWGGSGKCVGGNYGDTQAAGINEVTTKLSSGRVKATLHSFEAFADTFGLETDCRVQADGFMQP